MENAEAAQPIDVVVRCKDEMPYTKATLAALRTQKPAVGRVVFIDSGSKDGSRQCAEEFGCTIIDIQPSEYIPGRVINLGMSYTETPQVAFVNADAIPLHDDAVARLIAPLSKHAGLAATFARQVARPDAARITVSDMRRAFGEQAPVRTARGAFFSMAASAISREVWQAHPFDENLKYSEDVEWTHRVSGLGYEIEYVPQARFEHSHDYTPEGTRRRHHGEGVADTQIFGLGAPRFIQDFARPLVGNVLRDARAGNLSRKSILTRWCQANGYFTGRKESSAR